MVALNKWIFVFFAANIAVTAVWHQMLLEMVSDPCAACKWVFVCSVQSMDKHVWLQVQVTETGQDDYEMQN